MYSSPNEVKCDSGVAYYTLTMLCGESFTSFRFCDLNVVQERRFSFLLKTLFIHVLKTHLLALHDNPPRPTSLPFTPHPATDTSPPPNILIAQLHRQYAPTSFESMTLTILYASRGIINEVIFSTCAFYPSYTYWHIVSVSSFFSQ